MTAPFVFSYQLVGDGSQGAAAARQVRQEIEHLRDTATKLATGSTPSIDSMLGFKPGGSAGVAEYEQALVRLRGQLVPLFALEQQHEANLSTIAGAYKIGAISAAEQSAAIDRETKAHLAAVAALDGHTHAINANNAANGRAMAQRTNLIFQLNDIFVSLASGMNPAMVAIQQGSQIATIYGPGEGGIGAAFRETGKLAAQAATKFWPLALAVGGVAVAVMGMRHEIEETTGVAVSHGDVVKAVFQVLGGYLYETFRPQIEAIQGWFSWVWDRVIEGVKWVGNGIVSRIHYSIELLKGIVGSIPDFFLVAGEDAANFFIDGIEAMVRDAAVKINGLLTPINAIREALQQDPIVLFDPKSIDLPKISIDGADAARARLQAGWEELDGTLKDIVTRDYMGEFFGDVQQQAVANYNERLDETAKKAKQAALGVDDLKDAAKAFEEMVNFGRDTWRSFVLDIKAGALAAGDIVTDLSDALGAKLGGDSGYGPFADAIRALQDSIRDGRPAFDTFLGQVQQVVGTDTGSLRDMGDELARMAREAQHASSAWGILGEAGANALDRIADRALGMMADGIFDIIFGAVMGGLTGSAPGFSYGPGTFFDPWSNLRLNAKGNVYDSPSLSRYRNQVVDKPTLFAFARGAGLMGEAGPEAIMPLTRTRSGNLGVRMEGGGAGMMLGGITFAPVTNIYGSNLGEAEQRRLLDQRDRKLLAQVPGAMADAQRRAVPGAA